MSTSNIRPTPLRVTPKEGTVREHPDNYDADLLLRLYDLRREAKLRQAREWFVREFQAGSLEEHRAQNPPGSERDAFFRMVVGYWDMVGSIVNHGLIKEEFFFENTGEFWVVWDRIRKWVPAARTTLKNPMMWHNLETLAGKYEAWMEKRAPEALAALRERLQKSTAKKGS